MQLTASRLPTCADREKRNNFYCNTKGIVFEAKLLEIAEKRKAISCAVEKDGGDDPDITTGALVYAEVSYRTLKTSEGKVTE